jgi:hypothetical protein
MSNTPPNVQVKNMSTTVVMVLRGRLTAEFIDFLLKGRITNFIQDAPDVVKGNILYLT